VNFDLFENREAILNVLKLHAGTLTKLSLAKNKVTNEFMQYMCEGLRGLNKLEQLDLQHLKDTKNVNYIDLLTSISMLTVDSKRNINVSLSGYQTTASSKNIHKYLEEHSPYIEINIVS